MMPFLVHKDDRVLKLVHMCSLLPPFSGIHSERETLSSNIKSITATFSLPPFSLSLFLPLFLYISAAGGFFRLVDSYSYWGLMSLSKLENN